MLALSTTNDVLAAMRHAHSITFTSYVLRPGRVLSALQEAASRGERVIVRLEGRPYADSSGALHQFNEDAVASLRADGANASLRVAEGAPLHFKSAVIDGRVVFLDDRNWPDDGQDTILRDTDMRDVRAAAAATRGRSRAYAPLATRKDPALALEARAIYAAGNSGEGADVESESFGYGRIFAALLHDADRQLPVRLIVSQRDLQPRTRSALDKLCRHGVAVRISANDEKMAVTAGQAWLGSANATRGIEEQIDWGIRIYDRPVIAALQSRFATTWNAATPYTPGSASP